MRRERLAQVLDEHLGPALEELESGIRRPERPPRRVLADDALGLRFEDLLGRTYGGENFADLYLKRRGWKEHALARSYIEELRNAPVSLYQLSAAEPGSSMVLRDLVADAEPVSVREIKRGMLKVWDRIAVRVVRQRDHYVISGALLPFPAEAVELLLDGIRDALKLGKRKQLRRCCDQLGRCAPLFTNAWLFEHLSIALEP